MFDVEVVVVSGQFWLSRNSGMKLKGKWKVHVQKEGKTLITVHTYY
jgi:hypothetical protein